MTPDQRFTLIISALGFLFLVVSTTLGVMIRVIVRFTRVEDRVGVIMTDVERLVKDKENVHTAMLSQIKDDRKSADERLRWLERVVWREHGERGPDPA